MAITGIIYCAENNVNGKCYIGQTINGLDSRIYTHNKRAQKDNTYFHNALNKYDDWIWTIIQEYEADKKQTMKKVLDKAEIYYIETFDSYNSGYNMTKGGDGSIGRIPWNKGKKYKTGRIVSKETRDKIRIGNIGKKRSEDSKEKNRLAHLGKKASDETKNKMSKAHKNKKHIIVKCPCCGKEGGSPSMHQWHFNNCKERQI